MCPYLLVRIVIVPRLLFATTMLAGPPLTRWPIANPPQPVGTSITARENVPPREPRNSISLLFCAQETTISA